jgi:tetratricopeptide (TPR) repeat protein
MRFTRMESFEQKAWQASRSITVIAAAALVPGIAGAQSGPTNALLKPAAIEAPLRPVCSAVKPTKSPNDEQRQRARALAQHGQEAAILGDSPAALRDLRDASALDPTDPELAYNLARAYETAKDAANAANEYCRFLALSPTATEATEILEKVRLLAPPRPDPAVVSALAAFRSGAAGFERGELAVADSGFTQAIAFDSTWADAYYNRAYVHQARGDRASARADLEQYLKFKPAAKDRDAVAARVAALSAPAFSPFRALALGVFIPGAGEFYTGRPMRGVLTLVAVGGAATYAMWEKDRPISVQETATDPFGRPYTYTATRLKHERPNLLVGGIVAASVAGLSALDATVFAFLSTWRVEVRRVAVSFVPGPTMAVAKVSLLIQ